MRRLHWAGLALVLVLVLTLAGSLVAGIGRGELAVDATGEELPRVSGERVRVEVLNAAGVAGLARRATEQLREQGFDVVYYGNAARFGRDSSMVLDRMGTRPRAERVADVLAIPAVRSEPDSTLFVDVTVLLGRDWERPVAEDSVSPGT